MSTASSDDSEISTKIRKLDTIDDIKISPESIHSKISDLTSFKVKNVLQNNANRKAVFLRGTFETEEDDAVIILEKTGFSEEHFFNPEKNYFTGKNSLQQTLHNDIYGNYKYFIDSSLNDIKTTIIHPATEQHFIKYSSQNLYIVDETPAIYNTIVLPHLNEEQFDIQWVYNILEHKSESERIVCEDPNPDDGFVMVPDLKWNEKIESLYLLAISNKHNIKSLRDLTAEHLPLLKNIKKKGIEAIKSKYGLDASQLRIYLHYQPSFYHLHVHFCYLRYEAPGLLAERAHLLSNVISNIELISDYYQKATIPFVVREKENLFNKLESANVLKRCPPKETLTN